MLHAVNMPRNMSPVTNLDCAPWEMWNGHKLNFSKLRVLGCKAFCQIPKSAREGKFAPVSFMGVLVSYTSHSPAYCVWHIEKQKVYVAEEVYEEPLVFLVAPPPPADTYASTSGVPESTPADGLLPGSEDPATVPPLAEVPAEVPAPAQDPAPVPAVAKALAAVPAPAQDLAPVPAATLALAAVPALAQAPAAVLVVAEPPPAAVLAPEEAPVAVRIPPKALVAVPAQDEALAEEDQPAA